MLDNTPIFRGVSLFPNGTLYERKYAKTNVRPPCAALSSTERITTCMHGIIQEKGSPKVSIEGRCKACCGRQTLRTVHNHTPGPSSNSSNNISTLLWQTCNGYTTSPT